MPLNKKKKTILTWTIPSVVLIAAATVAVPVVVSFENKKNEIINGAPSFPPTPFFNFSNSEKEELLKNGEIDPSNFTVEYFVYNICKDVNSLNSVFSFEQYGLTKQTNDDFWMNENGVKYQIQEINYKNLSSETGNYEFVLDIQKTYKSEVREYTEIIKIPSSSFATKEKSEKNFVAIAAKKINDMFNSQNLKFLVNDGITEISQISKASDLKLMASSENGVAESFKSKSNENSVVYESKNEEFNYYSSNYATFMTPISEGSTKLILSATEAVKYTDAGEFDTSAPLYTFFKSAYDAGNLSYLPELTPKESEGLSDEQIVEKKIQKLIFDPSVISYEYNGTNKVPLSSYQATVVKVQCGDEFTYIVAWSNILSPSNSLVDNASKLNFVINKKSDGQEMTWNELNTEDGLKLIVPSQTPPNNLIYKAIKVEFKDEWYTTAIVTIQVSHPSLSTTMEYTQEIKKGFKSKAYLELENGINNVLGTGEINTSKLSPTISLKNSSTTFGDIANVVNNNSELEKLLNVTAPSGLTRAKYTIDYAVLLDNETLLVMYKLSSENDPTNYWKIGDTEQLISAKLTIPSTLVSSKT